MAASTIRPTTESSELLVSADSTHDSRGRSYVRSAIFIAAMRPEHSGLPSDNAAANMLHYKTALLRGRNILCVIPHYMHHDGDRRRNHAFLKCFQEEKLLKMSKHNLK
jgi:hypothetical protein